MPKTLSELLKYDAIDKTIFEHFFADTNFNEAHYRRICNMAMGEIYKLSKYHPKFKLLCEQENFNTHWKNKLAHFGGVDHRITFDHYNNSAFTSLMGHYVFTQYLILKKSCPEMTSEHLALLQEACRYQIFDALKEYGNYEKERLQDILVPQEEVTRCVRLANTLKSLYWTPGYFEASQLYLAIGLQQERQSREKSNLGLDCGFAYSIALECIYIAEGLENDPASKYTLGYAYGGKTIFEAAKYAFTSWEDAAAQTIKKFKITRAELERARRNSKLILKEYVKPAQELEDVNPDIGLLNSR